MIEIENSERPVTLEEALAKESVGLADVAIISANLQFVPKKDAVRLGLLKEWKKVNDDESEEEEDVPTEPKGKKVK